MPNYYTRPRGGLITPPGSNDMYGYRANNQYGQNNRKSALYETSAYSTPAAPMLYQPPMQYNNMPTSTAPGLMRASHFGPVGQPTLPPLADPSHQTRRDHQQEQRRQAPAKQDKVVGGVAQELDYEMDQMTDYVSEMAQSIIMPRSKVTPQFRKFVSGILSSTRLPSSTILLGLNYLSKRMSMLNTPSPYKSTEGQVWRMLTVALLLGSKFLDDNTFQNRSWSEVSSIPVAELNTMESNWLVAISWSLHVNFETDSDFQCWLASWESWKEQKNRERTATLDRLAPLTQLDTNIQRQRSQRKEFSPPYSMYGQSRTDRAQASFPQLSRYDAPSWNRPAYELSPPSAPESGPNTPEWMALTGSGLPTENWYNGISSGYGSLYNRRPAQPSYAAPAATHYQYNSHNQYNHSIWTGHPAGCGCAHCSYTSEPYFMSHNYGQQTVVG